ncbi:uncharacterized protein Z518_07867 [Rhinocladiella mackenziei CBS 650.93]|uniref:Choline monooxygenase, chloroplastic n=1 Tax=Rhinocladiella mackenziei CBS 650.93 TaxID=1442369 RepID=A0A0D2GUE5_9EURO|nr:uncharacterized protein Z518_07867 [Rhinocladiella mackenziei CBS 650.93]KIX01928.1 hypothetical protein Z518_07867 [Rhinocladiella mackenziei CBS 650.93]
MTGTGSNRVNGTGSYGAASNTLPASWYRAESMYELEKRAIFSKRWMCVSHEVRFKDIGDFVNFSVAGYAFFVIRDRKQDLKAFLNVCRHRAYPVVERDSGNASILACKYHGWSYGLSGNLAKAPRFETVDDFDKSKYSLYGVHLRIDKLGFVWVNLDAANPPTISWEEHFEGVDTQAKLGNFTMDEYAFDHCWEMEGSYNWKSIVDNYNECYHCTTAHPGIVSTTKLDTYDVVCQKGWIEHHAEPLEQVDAKYGVIPTYLFPNAAILISYLPESFCGLENNLTKYSDQYTYLTRFVPTSPTTLKMQYEVYRHKSISDEEFKVLDAFFKNIEREDKGLCDEVQRNLNVDGYVSGPLHPHNEKGVIYFKGLVKDAIEKHLVEEQKLGRKIIPSLRRPDSKETEAEEAFCGLVCNGGGGPQASTEW